MAKKAKEAAKSTGKPGTQVLVGLLDISRSGPGFVTVEDQDRDIFIKPNDLGKAFNGDRVAVEITNAHERGKRPEGRVKEIVQRKQTLFTGTLSVKNNTTFFLPKAEGMTDFYIPEGRSAGAKDGDRVVVQFRSWDKKSRNPEGEVISIMSAKNEADMAMKELLINANFPIAFDKELIKAAEKLSPRITREEEKKRKDFRDILTFTIDPDDAKDFDDAISLRNLDNGNYEVGVHIADVSHFVRIDDPLDKEAYQRATSVYLPDRVNPMLPEKISNELCSLRPDEDKYAFAAVFQITNRAEIKSTWIGRTIIRSRRRFTYEEVQAIIEGKEDPLYKPVVLLNTLAKQFRKQRFDNGAINFSSTEVKFKLDENGKPIGIVVKESKESHQLIEEFMLLANRAVAEYVSKIKINKEPIPFSYRTHDEPDPEKLKPFVAFAKKFGYAFDTKDGDAVAKSFNALLKAVAGKPEENVLGQLGIRTMAKAKYTSDNVGHYGLGFDHYCHFTSPIRRYPDVMVHRILQSILDKQILVDKKMDEKNKHCSERERAAMETERAANKYKQVEYMQQFIGQEFNGIISGVATFGFWVETVDTKCEGLVSVTDLSEFDDFRRDEEDYSLVGLRTGKRFRMGDDIRIRVVAANLEKRQLDYEWVNTQTTNGKSQKPKAKTPAPKKQDSRSKGQAAKGNAQKPKAKNAQAAKSKSRYR